MRNEKEIMNDIVHAQSHLKCLFLELSNLKQAMQKSNQSSYKKRKELLEESSKVFENILKPGDYVKVTGSRASPYREIKEILPGSVNTWGGWIPGSLVSATCRFNHRTNSIINTNAYDIITCGTNKITAVLRNGKWVTAKEILNQQPRNKYAY